MKKVLSLLAIVTLFTFVACNNASTTEDPAAETEATTNDQAEAEAMEAAPATEAPAEGEATEAAPATEEAAAEEAAH